MYQTVICPKHKKQLVFFKETPTHSLFKCPDCDYIDYPGVVHHNLPEKYNKLQAEINAYKKCSKDHKEKCPDVKCWVQILRDEQMDEIEQLQAKNKRLKQRNKDLITENRLLRWSINNHQRKIETLKSGT